MKLSTRNLKIVVSMQEQLKHNAQMAARVKAECIYLPEWYKDKPASWHEGASAAVEGIISQMLMEHKCYEGFRVVAAKCEISQAQYEYNQYYLSSAK